MRIMDLYFLSLRPFDDARGHGTHLRREFQAGKCFTKVSLQRADHDEHKSFRIAAKRELKEVGQLQKLVSQQDGLAYIHWSITSLTLELRYGI